MQFSDRLGITHPTLDLQLDSVSEDLRNSLWNLCIQLYENNDDDRSSYWTRICTNVAMNFRKFPLDELPPQNYQCRRWLKEYFFGLSWYGVYNLLEFLASAHSAASQWGHPVSANDFEHAANEILQREHSGYRFITHVLSPISDPVELDEVQAAALLHGRGVDGARKHIHAALQLFSKRPNADYRNAIKEAISAIESIVTQVHDGHGGGLASALRALEEKAELHGALRSAFEKLYGYTSDEEGIRHAMLQGSTVGFEEAKYMIVACSAGANYLATKAEKAGLLR